MGTAEQVIETTESYDRLCDIDNDGEDDYVKVIQTNCSVQTQIEVDYRGKETFSFLR